MLYRQKFRQLELAFLIAKLVGKTDYVILKCLKESGAYVGCKGRVIKKKRRNKEHTKIAMYLRNRLNSALKGKRKAGSAVKDLGCSVADFMQYMDAKFKPGMSWSNWGKKTWHIDHIKPLNSFDLTNAKEVKIACHYTNLQPLWYWQNISKKDRLDWVQPTDI